MTIDSPKLRQASDDVLKEKEKYLQSIKELDTLITTTLGQYWGDEAYDELKAKYIEKHRSLLEELGRVIGQFATNLNDAATDFDKTVDSLR